MVEEGEDLLTAATGDGSDVAELRRRLARRDREIESLRSALEAEKQAASKLRDRFDRLSQRVGQLDSALARVTAERDALQQSAAQIDRLHTATLALDEADSEILPPRYGSSGATQSGADPSSATIEQLMSDFSVAASERQERRHGVVDAEPYPASGVLLAPEFIVPEMFADEPSAHRQAAARPAGGRATTPTQAATPPRLIRLDGEVPGEYLITAERVTIGRAPEADISIDELCISRLHARLLKEGSAVFIEDAGSRNGVKINSERVERQQLQDGDVIGFGRLRFQFIDPSQAPLS